MLGKDRTIILINAAAESLFGLSRKQATGRTPASLVPELSVLEALFERALDANRSFGRYLTVTIPQRDFMTAELNCRVTPLNEYGAEQIIVELTDSTHWRQLDREKTIVSQREASKRIIRQLAHEIRNPLGGLRGAAQLLEREITDPRLAEYIRVIIGETDRLTALTRSLLGPTNQAKLTSINIHEPIEHVLLLIENDVPENISVQRDYDPSLPTVDLDRDQIVQAFLNIARNAIQAMGDRGQLTVRTRALTNAVIGSTRYRLSISVEFEDNGPGISADIMDSIFYPLVTDREDGTGLGLPLAQDLVNRQGGVIEFESEPGCTRFIVCLPVQEAEDAA